MTTANGALPSLDAVSLRRIRDGDPAALAALCERHGAAVLAFCEHVATPGHAARRRGPLRRPRDLAGRLCRGEALIDRARADRRAPCPVPCLHGVAASPAGGEAGVCTAASRPAASACRQRACDGARRRGARASARRESPIRSCGGAAPARTRRRARSRACRPARSDRHRAAADRSQPAAGSTPWIEARVAAPQAALAGAELATAVGSTRALGRGNRAHRELAARPTPGFLTADVARGGDGYGGAGNPDAVVLFGLDGVAGAILAGLPR